MTDTVTQIVDSIPEGNLVDVLAALRAKHFQYRDPRPLVERDVDLTKPGDAPENAARAT